MCRCCIICILIFLSCFPSSIISICSGFTYNYKPYFVASVVLLILSVISLSIFIKYLKQKIKYDNLRRIKIYNGINARLQYLNNHMILNKYVSFRLENVYSDSFCSCCYKQLTSTHSEIIVTLKTQNVSLPSGTIYQFRVNPKSKQYNQSLLDNINNNNNGYDIIVPIPSAPILSPNMKPKHEYNPKLLRNDREAQEGESW